MESLIITSLSLNIIVALMSLLVIVRVIFLQRKLNRICYSFNKLERSVNKMRRLYTASLIIIASGDKEAINRLKSLLEEDIDD